MIERILSLVTPYLPDDQRELLLASLRFGLQQIEKHGDVHALPNLLQQIEAAVLALEAGDIEAAKHLLDAWGVTSYLPLVLDQLEAQHGNASTPI